MDYVCGRPNHPAYQEDANILARIARERQREEVRVLAQVPVLVHQ